MYIDLNKEQQIQLWTISFFHFKSLSFQKHNEIYGLPCTFKKRWNLSYALWDDNTFQIFTGQSFTQSRGYKSTSI